MATAIPQHKPFFKLLLHVLSDNGQRCNDLEEIVFLYPAEVVHRFYLTRTIPPLCFRIEGREMIVKDVLLENPRCANPGQDDSCTTLTCFKATYRLS